MLGLMEDDVPNDHCKCSPHNAAEQDCRAGAYLVQEDVSHKSDECKHGIGMKNKLHDG